MEWPNDFINKIICGDCLEVMKKMPDNSVDLIVTSPPYDNLRDYNGYTFELHSLCLEICRVLKLGGVLVWIVGDSTINGSETLSSFKQAIKFNSVGLYLHDTMIYEKTGIPFPSKTRYNQCFEYMFVFSKGKPKTINLISDKINITAGSSRDTARYRTKDGWTKKCKWQIKECGIRNNIWRYSTGSNKSTKDKIAHEHPAIFPEQLAHDHIISWSNEGDIVLDPMCGSGTTCKMARLNNRNFIGIEISSDYVKIAEERLRQKTLL